MFELQHAPQPREAPRYFFLDDFESSEPRWCPGCGDHAVLAAVQRLARDEQLPPEKTVCVSGIGCSSRLPHYIRTYGFHGLHGRALPIACGVRSRRPDLHLFVITGDGDCCAIGTGHWVHAIRYNMKMTILMLDNNIYGLTKKQTSPTTRKHDPSNTHPQGALLNPLNPLSVTLGIANASFVAQTVDWNPPHLYSTLAEAHRHPGTAFIRVFQRCPHFTPHVFDDVRKDRSRVLLLTHPKGVPVQDPVRKAFPNQAAHDPSDLSAARAMADRTDVFPIGLFYRNAGLDRYDRDSFQGLNIPAEKRLEALNRHVDRFLV